MTQAPDVPPTEVAGGPSATPTPGRRQRLVARVEKGKAQVEQARADVPAVNTAFVVQGRDRRVGGNLLACAIAYRLFLWLLPVSLLIAAVLGAMHNAEPASPQDAAKSLGLSAYMASSVSSAATQASKSWWVLGVIAVAALYTASSGAAKTFRAVYALSWGVMLDKRKSWVGALCFTVFGSIVFGVAALETWVRHRDGLVGLWLFLGMVLLFAVLAMVIMLLLPHGDAPWTRLWPGVVVLAAGVQILHLVTVFYMGNKLQHSSELYGGLGAAAAILLWLYLIGRMFVAAAMVNATMWELHLERREAERHPVPSSSDAVAPADADAPVAVAQAAASAPTVDLRPPPPPNWPPAGAQADDHRAAPPRS